MTAPLPWQSHAPTRAAQITHPAEFGGGNHAPTWLADVRHHSGGMPETDVWYTDAAYHCGSRPGGIHARLLNGDNAVAYDAYRVNN
jgi:hypothetical protein